MHKRRVNSIALWFKPSVYTEALVVKSTINRTEIMLTTYKINWNLFENRDDLRFDDEVVSGCDYRLQQKLQYRHQKWDQTLSCINFFFKQMKFRKRKSRENPTASRREKSSSSLNQKGKIDQTFYFISIFLFHLCFTSTSTLFRNTFKA